MHSPNTPIAHVPTDQGRAKCPLLELPAKLRNNIYTLAFSIPTEQMVNFLDACPPSESLLITCRQIRGEAHGLHLAACQRYWSNTLFSLSFDVHLDDDDGLEAQTEAACTFIDRLRSDVLAQMNTLIIKTCLPKGNDGQERTITWKLEEWILYMCRSYSPDFCSRFIMIDGDRTDAFAVASIDATH